MATPSRQERGRHWIRFQTGASRVLKAIFVRLKGGNMATKAKVFVVKNEYQADYKVYFVTRKDQEKNAEIIAGGELADHEYQANVKVFITNHEYQASIKIMREHFPA